MASKLVDPVHPKTAAKYATDAAYAISQGGTDFHLWSSYAHGTYLPYKGRNFQLVLGHPDAEKWSE